MRNARAVKPKILTTSERADLTLPASRVSRYLRHLRLSPRTSRGAAIYLTAAMQYLAGEVLEAAGVAAREDKRVRISPRHLLLAVRRDEDLNKVFGHATIASGGVVPHIEKVLLPPPKGEGGKKRARSTAGRQGGMKARHRI